MKKQLQNTNHWQKIMSIVVGLMFLARFTYAQQISGKVTSQNGEPLPGASITVKNTTIGNVTKTDGTYSIEASAGNVLVFTFIGYNKQEVTAGSSKVVNVSLSEDAGSLSEVVVTAQKRSEDVQKIPISVSVMAGAKIAERGINSLENALRQMPGIEVQGFAQGAQLYIRGIGSSIDPSFADPSIALMVDGAYNGRTESVVGGVYDVERVEVLRGPQGTLYGRNATGGSVNLITNSPNLSKNAGYVRLQGGNFGLKKIEAMGNLAINNKFGIRVAAFKQDRNGYIDDGSNDAHNMGARLKMLYQVSPKVRVLGKIDIYKETGKGQNTIPVSGSSGKLLPFPDGALPPPFAINNWDFTNPGPPFKGGRPNIAYPNGWIVTDPSNPWSNNKEHLPGTIDRNSQTYSLQLDADLGIGNLTVLPSLTHNYSHMLSQFLFGSIVAFKGATYNFEGFRDETASVNYKSIEARLASKVDKKLKYLVGLYYLKSGPTPGYESISNTAASLLGDPISTNNIVKPNATVAVFAQTTYPLSKTVRLTTGLRFSTDKNAQAYSVVVDGKSAGSADFTQSVSKFQYKVGFEFDLAKNSMAYAHVATGFKQGGISPTIPVSVFDPETLTSYEIGTKNRFLNNKLQLNLSAFFYNYTGYQYSSFQTLPVGNLKNKDGSAITSTFSVISNAGNTKIKGLEFDAEFIPWKNGNVTFSATLLDAKYGKALLPNSPFVNQGDFKLDGKVVQNSPKSVLNIGLTQDAYAGKGKLSFNINTKVSEGFYTTPEQYMPGAWQAAFHRTNANVNYSIKKLTFGAFVNNLENAIQTTYVFPAYRKLVTSPRTFGLTAELRF
jgi:iron complex outermembrane recepter protein